MLDATFANADEYTAIFQDVLQELKERMVFAPTFEQRRLNSLLHQYEKLLRSVMPGANKWIDENVRSYFLEGDAFGQTTLPDILKSTPVNTAFTQVHEGAIIVVADAMKQFQATAVKAHFGVVRRFINKIQVSSTEQKDIMGEVARGILFGDDTKVVSSKINERLTARALNGYIQVGKKILPLDKYSELLARTNLRVGYTQGTLERLRTNEIQLVIVSEHGTECKICTPLEGRIFSISKKNQGKYPTLYALPNNGTPFHPNCLHVLLPFSVELAEPDELENGIIDLSKWPFPKTKHMLPS